MVHYGGSIENEIFWKGLFNSWETEVGWVWIELCRVSKVIFDIGANTGIYSLTAKCVNPDARIYAFEPSEKTFIKLIRNVELNNYDIACEKTALSSVTDTMIFYDVPDDNQTSASLSPLKLKYHKGYEGGIIEYPVKTYTLADYIIEKKISTIDLVKIDVELHEPDVIKGFGSCLKDLKPVILIEVLTEEVARQLNELVPNTFFYKFLLLADNRLRLMENFVADPHSWNYLVLHKNKLEDLKHQSPSLYKTIQSELSQQQAP